jgi:ubiquinone/menaquinone biosynthesis C-methylase UbiE
VTDAVVQREGVPKLTYREFSVDICYSKEQVRFFLRASQGQQLTESRVPKVDYSNIGEHYDRVRPVPARVWISRIVELGGLAPDSDVLDIGCGTGRFTTRVAARSGARLFGVDSSVAMLKNALKSDRKRAIRWVLGDASLLPFRAESFDCIYMTMVVHQIRQRHAFLKSLHRILRPGGKCVIATSSHSSIRAHVLRYFPGVCAIDLERFPSIPFLKNALKKTGFRNVRSSLVKHEEREIPIEDYFEMVRNKYISTLSLLGESKFQAGLAIFERRIRELYGTRMDRVLRFTFVSGEKPVA